MQQVPIKSIIEIVKYYYRQFKLIIFFKALYETQLGEFKKSINSATNGTGGSGLPEEVGGVKVCDMPIGPDALAVPGRRDGQTKMVKWPSENKITAHQWSQGT